MLISVSSSTPLCAAWALTEPLPNCTKGSSFNLTVVESKLLKIEKKGDFELTFEGAAVQSVRRGETVMINCTDCSHGLVAEVRAGDYLSVSGDGLLQLNNRSYEEAAVAVNCSSKCEVEMVVRVANHSKAVTFVALTGEGDRVSPLFPTSQRVFVKKAAASHFYFNFKGLSQVFVQASSFIPVVLAHLVDPATNVSQSSNYPTPDNHSLMANSTPFTRWLRLELACPEDGCLALVTVYPNASLFFEKGEFFISYMEEPVHLALTRPVLEYFRSAEIKEYLIAKGPFYIWSHSSVLPQVLSRNDSSLVLLCHERCVFTVVQDS